MTDYCTTGDLARRLGVPVWSVRWAADRELTDPPRRAAGYRLLNPEEAARVEQAPPTAEHVAKTQTAGVPSPAA